MDPVSEKSQAAEIVTSKTFVQIDCSAQKVPLSHTLLFVILMSVGLILDLWTKSLLFAWPELRRGEIYWLAKGYAGFQLSLNEGALFGMGQGQIWLIATVSLLAAVGIPIWAFRYKAASSGLMTIALGGIMAGIFGNLYDRIGMPGLINPNTGETIYAVRDWILWQASDQWRWPNFNLADVYLVMGSAALFWESLISSDPDCKTIKK